MREFMPLKFTSKAVEKDVRGVCAVHGLDFNIVEQCFNTDTRFILVEAGSVDYTKVNIGCNRYLENPSPRLDELIYAALNGAAFAHGQRLIRNEYDAGRANFLDEIRAMCEIDPEE